MDFALPTVYLANDGLEIHVFVMVDYWLGKEGRLMTTVSLRRGAIVVTDPPSGLKDELTYWKRELVYDEKKHRREMGGHYESLFVEDGNRLITMPGFGHRVLSTLRKLGNTYTLIDDRSPMPKPDMDKAFQGLYDYQLEPVGTMLASGGGILSAATGFGKTVMAAAMIRAFDPEQLKLRIGNVRL